MLEALQSLNLALAFALELGMLAGFAYWGWSASDNVWIQTALAMGLPALVAVLWGWVLAPRARQPLPWLAGLAIKTVLFVLAGIGLYVSGQDLFGVALVGLFAVHQVLAVLWTDPLRLFLKRLKPASFVSARFVARLRACAGLRHGCCAAGPVT
jgi:hypothetical protein